MGKPLRTSIINHNPDAAALAHSKMGPAFHGLANAQLQASVETDNVPRLRHSLLCGARRNATQIFRAVQFGECTIGPADSSPSARVPHNTPMTSPTRRRGAGVLVRAGVGWCRGARLSECSSSRW